MTIELIGSSEEQDAFGLIEVSGQKDEAGRETALPAAKGVLKIVEMELYSPANQQEQ